jgi:transposase
MKTAAFVANKLDGIAASLSRQGRGRKPEPGPTRRKIERLLEDNHFVRHVAWKFTGGRGGRRLQWNFVLKAEREAEKLDGKYVLITTLDLTPQEILELYRARDKVERAFRITKEVIKSRPIWNHKESHIKAHLFNCYLAYLLMSLVQIVARRSDPKLSALKALQKMAGITKRVERLIRAPEGARDALHEFVNLDS